MRNSSDKARITIRPDLGAGLTRYEVLHRGAWTPVFRTGESQPDHPFALSNIVPVPFSGRVSGGGSFDGVFHRTDPNLPTEIYPIHGCGLAHLWNEIHATQPLADGNFLDH